MSIRAMQSKLSAAGKPVKPVKGVPYISFGEAGLILGTKYQAVFQRADRDEKMGAVFDANVHGVTMHIIRKDAIMEWKKNRENGGTGKRGFKGSITFDE